jgi:hypothetical protein
VKRHLRTVPPLCPECVPAPPDIFERGPAALESAAASVVALTCGLRVVGGFGWL